MIYKLNLIWILVMGLLVSCIDDRGNYDYLPEKELLPTAILGLEENYSFRFGETRHLEVQVEGDQELKNLRYMWYIYKVPNISERDTLGYGKSLDYYVSQESGKYHLWFEVRDTVRDICINQMADLAVESVLSSAWLMMKSEHGGTDMDALLSDGSVVENVVHRSIGTSLQGDAVKVVYNSEHSHEVENADGTVEVVKQKVFYVMSDREIKVFNAENMHLVKSTTDCFYEAPGRIKVGNCASNGRDMYLINDGKYHGFNGMTANVGKFSYAKPGPDDVDYDLHADCMRAGQYLMVFDRLSRSFMWAYYANTELAYFNDPVSGTPDFGSLRNMDVQLKHLMFRSSVYDWNTYSSSYLGYAVMDDEQGKYYLADLSYTKGGVYPVKDYKALPAGCQLGSAEVAVAHKKASAIFFAQGDELWVHEVNDSQDAGQRERRLTTFSGEEITYLRHVQTAVTSSVKLDLMVVVTHSGGKWKLYGFPFIGGGSEFDATVDKDSVLMGQGSGRVAYCLRMSDNYEY